MPPSTRASGRLIVGRAQAVVCAVLMPHAPILVPAVGGARGGAAAASCQAMRAAAAAVLSYRPETLVLISPHSPRQPGAFGLWADDRLEGSFEQFGAPQAQVSLPNDRRLANALAVEAQSRAVAIWANSQLPARSRRAGAAVVPGRGRLGRADGYPQSQLFGRWRIDQPGRSHRRGRERAASPDRPRRQRRHESSADANAPCGFHPQAHEFDETFIHLVRAGNYREIQQINPDLRELAAEDAVDSTLIAAAAVGWQSAGHRVLNYEGPFGVGYGVAILFAENPETSPG